MYLPTKEGSVLMLGLSSDTKPIPPNPSTDLYNFIEMDTGKFYYYLTSAWVCSSSNSYMLNSKITVSTTAPASPSTGDLWVDTN